MLKNLNWETKFTFTSFKEYKRFYLNSLFYKYLLEISPILSCLMNKINI